MPKVQQVFTLDVSPDKFLSACSMNELIELDLLLPSEIRRRQQREAAKQLEDGDFKEDF